MTGETGETGMTGEQGARRKGIPTGMTEAAKYAIRKRCGSGGMILLSVDSFFLVFSAGNVDRVSHGPNLFCSFVQQVTQAVLYTVR